MNKLPEKELIDFVVNQGENSTSFLTLYSGFSYFQTKIRGHKGLIAYLDSTSAWIGASDPICSDPSITEELIFAFFAEAGRHHKDAIILPVSKSVSDLVRSKKLFSIQIGSVPWFQLKESPTLLTPAKQLLNKGAIVESFDPIKINSREYVEIEDLTKNWLRNKNMPALGFLNRLEPWVHLQYKKYFRVIFNGHHIGFLAAVPTSKNKGWYLVDLIRLPNSPVGTTELLIHEAMKQLRTEGYSEVTLGMSPLVCLDLDEKKIHPKAYRILDLAFNRLDSFYNFKSLYQYKEKFNPSSWEPTFLVASTKSLSLLTYYSLFRVLLPHGFTSIFSSLCHALLRKFDFKKTYSKLFSNQLVLRGMPNSIFEFIFRIKTTLILIVINILFFSVANDDNGNLRERFINDYAYRLNFLIENGMSLKSFQSLIIPSLLHWNLFHLSFNLFLLTMFVGFLELLAGSSLVSISYLFGILLSNPLTSLFLLPFIYIYSPDSIMEFKQNLDVGSSLGIFSCIGVFTYLLKNTKSFLIFITICVCIVSTYEHDVLSLNHITAMAIGLGLAHFFIPKELP